MVHPQGHEAHRQRPPRPSRAVQRVRAPTPNTQDDFGMFQMALTGTSREAPWSPLARCSAGGKCPLCFLACFQQWLVLPYVWSKLLIFSLLPRGFFCDCLLVGFCFPRAVALQPHVQHILIEPHLLPPAPARPCNTPRSSTRLTPQAKCIFMSRTSFGASRNCCAQAEAPPPTVLHV